MVKEVIKMKILKNIVETRKILEDLLSLDRLEKLAEKNQFIAIAYAEALMHVNYHLLTWDKDTWMKVGTDTRWFPLTIEGKLAGIGQSFAHSAGKLDILLGTAAIQQITGMGEVAADIAKAVLGASRVAQKVTTSRAKKKEKKKK